MADSSHAADLLLDATEQRVLGSLMEKQVTVPSTYPMSLNSLRLACNQATSRDPITEFDEATVQECLRGLRLRELVRVVHGDRVLKYHQLLADRLALADDERALITVLLLRGAQSPGELKTRTDRLHAFADRAEVESCLARLASLDPPLVAVLPKAPGQHDARWIHLLGPVALPVAVATA
ncbi:MAG: YceH family protein, partial [Candidatus Phosphoribacter baldrii]